MLSNNKIIKRINDIFSLKYLDLKVDLLILIFLIADLILFSFIFDIYLKIQENQLTTYAADNFKAEVYPYIEKVEDLNISAKAAIVFEKDSRVVLLRKNEELRFSPASSAKIMTAIVSLENYFPNSIFEVKNISKVEGSKMGLVTGEKMTLMNLLYGLLLPSGNDAAYVLSSNFLGGEEAFINKMNEKAKELKLYNTHFVDPSGYEDSNYTTAFDLARLASYSLDNNTFSNIVQTRSIVLYDNSFKFQHNLENLNKLLGEDGVNGIKTGFTEEAGGVLVTSIKYEGKTFIIVVLKSGDRFLDTKNIITTIIKKIKLLSY